MVLGSTTSTYDLLNTLTLGNSSLKQKSIANPIRADSDPFSVLRIRQDGANNSTKKNSIEKMQKKLQQFNSANRSSKKQLVAIRKSEPEDHVTHSPSPKTYSNQLNLKGQSDNRGNSLPQGSEHNQEAEIGAQSVPYNKPQLRIPYFESTYTSVLKEVQRQKRNSVKSKRSVTTEEKNKVKLLEAAAKLSSSSRTRIELVGEASDRKLF